MWVGWRWRTPWSAGLRIALSVALFSLVGCLTESTRTRSVTVSRGYYVAPPVSQQRHVTVLLSHGSSKTQAVVHFIGRCSLVEVGEHRRIVERRKHVTVITVVLTGLFVGAGLVAYMLPDEANAEERMTVGTALLASGGVIYGIPALQQYTETTEVPPRPVERLLRTVECPVAPVKEAQVLIRDANGERTGTTDQRGIVVLEGEPGPGVRVFVDGQPVNDVRRHGP